LKTCIKKEDLRYKSLAISGGGIKGLSGVGVLSEFEKRKNPEGKPIIDDIKRVIGTSAGGILATLIAVGYTSDELKKVIFDIDFTDFKDSDLYHFYESYYASNDYGLYKGNFFLCFIKKMIAEKTGDPNITFRQLHERILNGENQFKDLYITLTNVSRRIGEVASYESPEYQDLPIALAARATMSIPIVFKAVKFPHNDDLYVDGVITYENPIDHFDKKKYIEADCGITIDPNIHAKFINPTTIGIRLNSREELDLKANRQPTNNISSHMSFMRALIETASNAQNLCNSRNPFIDSRTIFCSSLGVNPMDFGIDDETKNKLINSGVEGTKEYFAANHDEPQPILNQFGMQGASCAEEETRENKIAATI